MAQVMKTIHHVFHTIMFSVAMQAHYSTASILAYLHRATKWLREQSRFMCFAAHGARLTSTAGFTVSE